MFMHGAVGAGHADFVTAPVQIHAATTMLAGLREPPEFHWTVHHQRSHRRVFDGRLRPDDQILSSAERNSERQSCSDYSKLRVYTRDLRGTSEGWQSGSMHRS